MRRTISLDGPAWQVKGFLGLDAALNAAARNEPASIEAGWLPGRVPGSVLDDLWRAGEVPNPYVERNSLAAEWVPERAWLYQRTLPPGLGGLGHDDRAVLRFEGLDHAGHVFLSGDRIATHEGMFVPFEVDVTEVLRTAGPAHTLSVIVEPAPASEPQVGRTSRVRVHKSRMTYGWDFCPRMVHQGIWQPVSLVVSGSARITDVWARQELSPDFSQARVEVRSHLDLVSAATVVVEAELARPGAPSAEAAPIATASRHVDLPAGSSEVGLRLDVRDPALWWPNGAGTATVHSLVIRVCGPGGVMDERAVPVGFRRIELVRNEGSSPTARPYTFVVNGRRTYVKGWNWVPQDVMYGVPRRERLAHLIRLAAAADVNLLRVWGGGLIETEPFYDLCDRAGILVWQEFSQSSSGIESTPAGDPRFVEEMAREAEAIVPLRRNHPSLVVWCGGNELEGPLGPLGDDAPVLATIKGVVNRLDPDRVWLPSSPSGPQFHNRLDVIASDPDGLHDVHGPWEHQGLRAHHELYDRGTSLFNSEFGVEGMTNRRTHEALIREGRRWPATRANPVYRHLGDWWNNEPLVQASFGGRIGEIDTLRRASQLLQAEGLRYAVEANRRRSFRNSGSIPWQFNESYPNAWCTSAVDHRGDPKPAYHAVRRAYGPVVICAAFDGMSWSGRDRFEASVWAWADDGFGDATAVARILDFGGARLAEATWPLELAAGPALRIGEITHPVTPDHSAFLLDLRIVDAADEVIASSRYPFTATGDLVPLLELAPATINVSVGVVGDGWSVELEQVSGPAAFGLTIEDDRPIEAPGWAVASDGGFHLLPHERRTIDVSWDEAPVEGRRLRLSAWNVDSMMLEVAT